MTLWLDVEDLFHYALRNPRPSGIQRLSFEIYAELHALLGDGVRFVRHDVDGGTLRAVPWDAVRGLFAGLLLPTPPPGEPAEVEGEREEVHPEDMAPEEAPRRGLWRLTPNLPPAVREPVGQAVDAQRQAVAAQWAVVRHGGRAVRALPRILRSPTSEAPARPGPAPEVPDEPLPEVAWPDAPSHPDIREEARPGDTFAVLGSPWFRDDYAGFVGAVTWDRGMRTALLIYDLIPLVRPEWCDRGLVRLFGDWYAACVPHVDVVFAISHATARDVEAWSARTGIAVALPVRVLPIGTGFSGPPVEAVDHLPEGLEPGSYVLFVSTVEARKNHLLAFRAWRRMVEEMEPDAVPTLVLAGRVGWLVADLMQQLDNCRWLGGKIVLVRDPTDAELVALYKGCRFTLFPSLYEGWGLPVTESLSFGKVCVGSGRTSVPEAGGDFCLYVDPEDVTGATEVIRRACTDDALIAAMEARIRDSFRPTPWKETAEALLEALEIAVPR